MKFFLLIFFLLFYQKVMAQAIEMPLKTVELTEVDEAKFDKLLSNKKIEVRKNLVKCLYDQRDKRLVQFKKIHAEYSSMHEECKMACDDKSPNRCQNNKISDLNIVYDACKLHVKTCEASGEKTTLKCDCLDLCASKSIDGQVIENLAKSCAAGMGQAYVGIYDLGKTVLTTVGECLYNCDQQLGAIGGWINQAIHYTQSQMHDLLADRKLAPYYAELSLLKSCTENLNIKNPTYAEIYSDQLTSSCLNLEDRADEALKTTCEFLAPLPPLGLGYKAIRGLSEMRNINRAEKVFIKEAELGETVLKDIEKGLKCSK